MGKRVNTKLVAFQFPFLIDDIEIRFPPGEYAVEIEEETILGTSFQTYRHIQTVLVKHPPNAQSGPTHTWPVNHEALARAIDADADRFRESRRAALSAQNTSNKKAGSE